MNSDSDRILNPGSQPVLHSDDTETTASLSQTHDTNHVKFSELEAHICVQNKLIKKHQAEFIQVNRRFDLLESQVMTTLEFCKVSSENVMELR